MDDGLSRVTVQTPYRRLDVALPARLPVAELLPELLRHAGASPAGEPVGWVLRRSGGRALVPGRDLREQQVHEGEVLHLVPERLRWPEPASDDPVAEAAAVARARASRWDGRASRAVALAAGGLLLATGPAVTVLRPAGVAASVPAAVAVALLAAAAATTRRGGDPAAVRQDAGPAAGTLLGAGALPYAYLAGVTWAGGALAVPAGAAALLLASLLGLWWCRRPGGDGPPGGAGCCLAGATVGAVGAPASLLGAATDAAGGAAVLACLLVCGVAALPAAAVRLSALPEPPVRVATGPGPVELAVARADEALTGMLAGWSVLVVAATGVLVTAGGTAGRVLAGATATAMLARSRVYVAVGQRLALLAGGVAGSVVVGVWLFTEAPDAAVPVVVAVAAAAAVATVAGPVAARRPDPLLGRLAVAVDLVPVLAAVPLAAAVLGLYGEAAGLMTGW